MRQAAEDKKKKERERKRNLDEAAKDMSLTTREKTLIGQFEQGCWKAWTDATTDKEAGTLSAAWVVKAKSYARDCLNGKTPENTENCKCPNAEDLSKLSKALEELEANEV